MKTKISIILLTLLTTLTSLANQTQLQNLLPQPKSITELSQKTVKSSKPKIKITKEKNSKPEAYKLSITRKNGIEITASTQQGVLWAQQTLEQLRDRNGHYPEVIIEDYPAFSLRGFMLDTRRNFMEVDLILDYLRLMSKYKVNLFHWHLTDNPAAHRM